MRRGVWLVPRFVIPGGVLLAACTPATEPRKPDVSAPVGTTPTRSAARKADTPEEPGEAGEPANLPHPTAMEADLKELGLDPKALPPLEKLEPSTLRKVMKTFTKSLGVPCAACHDVQDFRAATPKKTIARHMWNDFARGLATTDGAPLYCDSCHAGKATFLDRSDRKRLADWMQQGYVSTLSRTDGKEHHCATCHGEPFEGHIFGKRWK